MRPARSFLLTKTAERIETAVVWTLIALTIPAIIALLTFQLPIGPQITALAMAALAMAALAASRLLTIARHFARPPTAAPSPPSTSAPLSS